MAEAFLFLFLLGRRKEMKRKTGNGGAAGSAALRRRRASRRRSAGQDRPPPAGSPPSTTCSRTPVAVAYSAGSRANRPAPAGTAAGAGAAFFSVAFFSIDSILETLMTSTSSARAQAASAAAAPQRFASPISRHTG